MNRWYPNLTGVEPKVADAIRLLWDSVYGLAGRNDTSSVISNSLQVEGSVTVSPNDNPAANELITKGYADKKYSNPTMTKYPSASLAGGTLHERPPAGEVDGQVYIDWDSKKIWIWRKNLSIWHNVLDIL